MATRGIMQANAKTKVSILKPLLLAILYLMWSVRMGLLIGETVYDLFTDDIDDHRYEEQGESQLDESGEIYPFIRLGELVGDDAGHGIAGREKVFGKDARVPDDHGDGHGLPQRSAQGKKNAG